MDCSTTSTGGVEGRAFAVGSLLAALAKVPDRRKRRGVRYALPIVLGLLTLAKLAGQDHPAGMAQWVQERAAWLIQAFGLKRTRLPHRTTYLRVLLSHSWLVLSGLEAPAFVKIRAKRFVANVVAAWAGMLREGRPHEDAALL